MNEVHSLKTRGALTAISRHDKENLLFRHEHFPEIFRKGLHVRCWQGGHVRIPASGRVDDYK